MVFNTIAGIFILAVVCGVGFGVAAADSADDAARAGAFGLDAATTSMTARPAAKPAAGTSAGAGAGAGKSSANAQCYEQSALASPSPRSIDRGLEMIDAREEEQRRQAEAEAAAERARIEAENAAALDRVVERKAMQGVVQGMQELAARNAEQVIYEYDLPAVDWTVGRDDFVSEWTARIDAYLAGSALDGTGRIFAEAAWDNGVDPRWSPAISCTESTKGSVCFLPHNAWGWGESSWGDWETAIRAHVAGLAEAYGYCITPEAAAQYCPPNATYWYANTVSQMACI